MLRQYAPVAATASKSPGVTSEGNQVSRTTMSPLSQCLPTTRASLGAADDDLFARVHVYAAS
jgi:hypothetical protein